MLIQKIKLSQLPLSLQGSYHEHDGEDPCIFAAIDQDSIVGFIASSLFNELKEAILSWIQVIPSKQNQKIGTELMNHLIHYLKDHQFKMVNLTYPSNLSSTSYFEKILKNTGWKKETFLQRYYFSGDSFNPSWFHSSFDLKNYSLFLWKDARKEELDLAKNWAKNPSIFFYSPFDATYLIEPNTSLGLRFRGELVGWLINHQINSHLLRYSALYVLPEIRGSGAAIWMLQQSIHLHLKHLPELQGLMEINLKLSHSSWKQFITKRLASFAIKIENVNYAYNRL